MSRRHHWAALLPSRECEYDALPMSVTPDGFVFPLRDGTRVLLRPVRGEDRPRIQVGLARLSPQSRYLRFFSGMSELTEKQLRYLTEVDQFDHVAWGALDPAAPGLPGLAMARFAREEEDATVAELAVVVLDSVQGRGLGSVMLGVLFLEAPRCGIRTFRALVLPENEAVVQWFARLGATVRREPDLCQVDLPIVDDSALPDTGTARRFAWLLSALRPLLRV